MSRVPLMTLVGAIALAAGIAILLRPGLLPLSGEGAAYALRIAGTMLAALGLALTIFAVGLSRPSAATPSAPRATNI